MACVLMPLPARDFDPSEVAISWQVLSQRGHRVRFATPDGRPAEADPLMVSGEGLDLWGWIPGLRKFKLLGLAMRADARARAAYRSLTADPEFRAPLRHDQLAAELAAGRIDGLLLPGGHWARGMKDYLESRALHDFVAAHAESGRPFAAVCHGTVLAARSISPRTGQSILHGRKTTGLTWRLEATAWRLMKYLGRFWDPDYYRTYRESPQEPPGYWSVQAEVRRALADPADFLDVPRSAEHHFMKASGLFRDTPEDDRPAFVVVDGDYVSARWPGDAHLFARRFAERLEIRTA